MATLLSVLGCGGGSSSSGTATLDLFITDDLTPDYTGVWVKVYKGSLGKADGSSTTVFESSEGLPVNLRQLNDGTARFLLLAPGPVPEGTYDKVEVILDKTVTLVATGSGTTTTANFPDTYDTTDGKSRIGLTLDPNLTVPGPNRLVIDFDLKNWTVTGGVVTPVVKRHDGSGLDDPSRHEKFEFKGIIADLSGLLPPQTFALRLRTGGKITVETTVETDIFIEGGATAGGNLANGLKAEVYGSFDPATRRLVARVVKAEVEDEDDRDEAKIVGPGFEPNVGDGSFKIRPRFIRGAVPRGDVVNVATTSGTKFKGRRGATLTKGQFFAAFVNVGSEPIVQVEGIYTPETNTITAKSCHIESDAGMGDAEAEGETAEPNAQLKKFKLFVFKASGFDFGSEAITVQAVDGAKYYGVNDQLISATAFFEALAAGSKKVEVKGGFRDGVFYAGKLELEGEDDSSAEAKGQTVQPNAELGTFKLEVTESEGFTRPEGKLSVQILEGARITNRRGEEMTKAAFFEALGERSRFVKAEGSFVDGVLKAIKVRWLE
jgi:hypothetical protein